MITIPTFEAVEAVCIIGSDSRFNACIASSSDQHGKKRNDIPSINFITVGERGVVRIWKSDRYLSLIGTDCNALITLLYIFLLFSSILSSTPH